MSALIEETINRMTSAVNQVYGPKVGIIEGCTVLVKKANASIDDILNAAPGTFVKVSSFDRPDFIERVTIIPGDVHYEHVAGIISEDV